MEDRENWTKEDTILCDECSTCYSCGKFIHEDDCHYTDNDYGPYCPKCYHNLFTICSVCEEICEKGNTYSHGSYTLCYGCADYHIFCYDCDNIVHVDNVYSMNEDSENFCKNCFLKRYPTTNLPSLGDGVSNSSGRQDLEEAMATVILRYYANIATNLEWGSKEQFRLTEEELKTVAQYFVTTAAAELRNATKCQIIVDHHWCLKILHTHCNSINWRLSSSRNLVMGTTSLLDISINDSLKFLRSAYVVFYSENWKDLDGSFGGKNWANCCLQAINLLSALNSQNGYADNLLWEMCLNASHNNSNWLNKVPGESGTLWVAYVLDMGANLSPKQILDIYYAKDPLKALPCNGMPEKVHCDFSRLPSPESVWFYDDNEEIPELSCSVEVKKDIPVVKTTKKPDASFKMHPETDFILPIGKHKITWIPTSMLKPQEVYDVGNKPELIEHSTELKGDIKYDPTKLEELYYTISDMQTTPGLASDRPIQSFLKKCYG
jgi:hypothetical protein